ncbi:MAG: Tim44 domain-containing protein, partial [Roseburia sp.]|nr:Tim44 domain-containing protein [Roseburia sp.]
GGGGGSHSHHSSHNKNVTGKESLVRIILHTSFAAVLGAGGTIVLIYYSRKAKRNSIRLMRSYQNLGVNWNYKEVQKYVEEAYFIIQEAWRRYDTSYAAGYLSEELEIEWNAKLQWMQIRNEEIVQKRVRLLSAVPVGVHDEAGEDKDQIWYLIHGKMLGYYRDRDTKRHIRGDLQDKAFFEYWLFVRRNGRWVLHQIRQRNEIDIQEFLE